MKNKQCRTSKLNILFDLTSSFSKTYYTKKEKTQTQKVLESHLVAHKQLQGLGIKMLKSVLGMSP